MPLKRYTQITESHCGPAVIQMLFSFYGIETSQVEITQAAGAEDTVDVHGVRVEQMAQAVHVLAPYMVLYYKQYATFSDIQALLIEYQLPVGVEWQGLFYDDEEEEVKGEDYGHYSIVTSIDYVRKALVIVDPYQDYAESDRMIEIYKFLNRWWDVNEIKDPLSDKPIFLRDDKVLFIVTPRDEALRQRIGLSSYY